jgi:hypothetical protein
MNLIKLGVNLSIRSQLLSLFEADDCCGVCFAVKEGTKLELNCSLKADCRLFTK